MNNLTPLNLLPVGSSAKIFRLTSKGITRRRMLDLGLIKNTLVKSLFKSPSGDPIAYEIRGTVIALRKEDASKIFVKII
jgi:ferrous iron transport protein A